MQLLPTTTENNHGNPDESVDEAHQDIESGHYLAGLENGDSDQLLFHSLWLVEDACFSCGLTIIQLTICVILRKIESLLLPSVVECVLL
jgi:hypothetical protein